MMLLSIKSLMPTITLFIIIFGFVETSIAQNKTKKISKHKMYTYYTYNKVSTEYISLAKPEIELKNVFVELIDGSKLNGNYLFGDESSISIEFRGNEIEIDRDEIASISFQN